MPDKRKHRGAHPDDEKLFSAQQLASLRAAVSDFSMLLTGGYAARSALKLVGDRYQLTSRQRLAVMRSACSDEQLAWRKQNEVSVAALAGRGLAVDGYNVLITVEAALSDGFVFIGRDGCYRDLAGLHGTYRKVNETVKAIELIGTTLQRLRVSSVIWFLDRPVSNSGRLKQLIGRITEANRWQWDVELVCSPDKELCRAEQIVATSDGVILDRAGGWVNLVGHFIRESIPSARVINLACE